MTIRNPKQEGSNIFDAIPQKGPCQNNCNQCFYNRDGAFFTDINQPHMPDPNEVDGKIVRVNSGHDSNIQKDLVISATSIYKDKFFNTSIPDFSFPGPVVFTANCREEEEPYMPENKIDSSNIMFVRLRVSAWNLHYIDLACNYWSAMNLVPTVLTFMRYYDRNSCPYPSQIEKFYEWKEHVLNSYFCPKKEFIKETMQRYKDNNLVHLCGTLDSSLCKDCKNCETFYYQKRNKINLARPTTA